MRILILTHNLTGGGAERVATLWATGFVKRSHEVGMVLNCPETEVQTYPLSEKVCCYNIFCWVANKLYRKFGWDFYYIFRLRRIIYEFHPDVIIGVMLRWSEWARKATLNNIPIISTEHNVLDLPAYAPQKREQDVAWRLSLYRHYKYITVLTEADKKYVEKLGYKVYTLPNPLAFVPLREIPKKEHVILAAGRLDAWHIKGFDLLLKAWAQIAGKHPDWSLQIAGAGSKKNLQYLSDVAREYHIDEQTSFLGFQPNLLNSYRRASIFVLSSRYEGFGMVLIEAMSQGCAPIACDYKGRQREIIRTDEEGVICPVDDLEALAKAIDKMINDDEYRNFIQHNAIERSKNYSLDNIMDRWEDILKRL